MTKPTWANSRFRAMTGTPFAQIDALIAAILGGGGAGSNVGDVLAREGFCARGRIAVLDHDCFEPSDLPRNALVAACEQDRAIGKGKASWAARVIRRRGIPAEGHKMRVEAPRTLRLLRRLLPQVIFDCLDNDGGRLTSELIGRALDVPVIHVGMGMSRADGSAGGQVFVSHRGACLLCLPGAIDVEQARLDLLPLDVREQRRREGYDDARPTEPTPMSAHLCAIVAGLAVQALIDLLAAPENTVGEICFFSLREPAIRRATVVQDPSCPLCTSKSAASRRPRKLPLPKVILRSQP